MSDSSAFVPRLGLRRDKSSKAFVSSSSERQIRCLPEESCSLTYEGSHEFLSASLLTVTEIHPENNVHETSERQKPHAIFDNQTLR